MSKKLTYIRIIFVFSLILIIALLFVFLQPKPTGGEIYAPDFKDGFSLYVEEEHSIYFSLHSPFIETPHTLWLVTDESVKTAVYNLCSNLERYREFLVGSDVMLGMPSVRDYLPKIFFETPLYGYTIEVINWRNYGDSTWDSMPIKVEMFDEPVLYVKRYDFSMRQKNEDTLGFFERYYGADSLNTEYEGLGWYSTLSQEQLDELLYLLSAIGTENAEIAKSIESYR